MTHRLFYMDFFESEKKKERKRARGRESGVREKGRERLSYRG